MTQRCRIMLLGLCLGMCLGLASMAAAGELIVYYGTSRDLFEPVVQAFAASRPDIKVSTFRQPNEELMATVELEIRTEDRPGLLAKITQVISAANSNIQSIQARTLPDGTATIDSYVTTPDRKHLDKLLVTLRSLPGVNQVRRKFNSSRPVTA